MTRPFCRIGSAVCRSKRDLVRHNTINGTEDRFINELSSLLEQKGEPGPSWLEKLRTTPLIRLPPPNQLTSRSKKFREFEDPTLPKSWFEAARWTLHHRQPNTVLTFYQRAAILAHDCATLAQTHKITDKRIALCAYAGGWRFSKDATPTTAAAKARQLALNVASSALAAVTPGPADVDLTVDIDEPAVIPTSVPSAQPSHVADTFNPATSKLTPADAARVSALEHWLRDSTVQRVEDLYDLTRQVRRHLPNSRAGNLAVAVFRMSARLALSSTTKSTAETAEAMLIAFPAIILNKRIGVAEAVDAILTNAALQPQTAQSSEPSFDEITARALRDAVISDHRPSILRVLDRTQPKSERAIVSQEQLAAIADEKFRQTHRGEVVGDERHVAAVNGLQAETTSSLFSVGPAFVKQWARRSSGRAPDLYGWTGSLVSSMIKHDHAVAGIIATLASRPPALWASATAANGVWREMKGCLIPKPDGGWRPIAIPHVFRRIWSAAVTAEIRPLAARYCVARGQLGLSGDGAAAAYAAIARACLAAGGTVCTDDRRNSFGELDRSAVIDAATAFVTDVHEDRRNLVRAQMGALLHRLYLGPSTDQGNWDARTTHVYPRVDMFQHVNHGLVQGSPESSLLEAIVYAHCADKRLETRSLVRLSFHDDGYSATPNSAVLPSAFARPKSEAGAPFAHEKARAFGACSEKLVAASIASCAPAVAAVIGVPIDHRPDAWVEDVARTRLEARMATLSRLSQLGYRQLAVATAAKLGGPAALSTHFLRATPPSADLSSRLRELDEKWVDFWCGLCSINGLQNNLRHLVATRVYGPKPDGLGHQRSATAHRVAHSEGTLAAIPYVVALRNVTQPLGEHFEESILRSLAMPNDEDDPFPAVSGEGWKEKQANAHALIVSQNGYPEDCTPIPLDFGDSRLEIPGASAASDAVITRDLHRHHVAAAVTRRRDKFRRFALDEKISNRRQLQALAHGARSTPPTRASDGGPLNMLIEALSTVADPTEGDAETDDVAAGVILARAFGLPIGRAPLDELPLQSAAYLLAPGCPLCGAATSSLFGRAEGNCKRDNVAPTNVWDDRADHATVCRKLALMRLRRHNAIARTIAQVARRAGLEANVDEKSMLADGGPHTGGRRPNDVTIMRFDGSRVAAIDVTVTTDLSTSAAAEQSKNNKHAGDFAAGDALFFPFALTVQGDVGLGAKLSLWDVLRAFGPERVSVDVLVCL